MAGMSSATLHYIHDPLCGWCYGAAPLVKAAREVLPVVAHAGGMMTGERRQPVTPQLRDFVMPHDRRIAQRSGQPFEAAYFDGLLRDPSAVFDSAPPIAAMLAAERLAGRGLDMLARMQTEHYVEGRRIADRQVLVDLAQAIGLDVHAFEAALTEADAGPLQAHISATRALMARVGAQGFPWFVLEVDGHCATLDAGRFMGQPEAFATWLRERLPSTSAARAI
jgi:putative protein-disulfide isomerase